MTFSIIQKSRLEGALRLDAEYYQSGFLDLAANLKKCSLLKLGDLSEKIDVGFVSSMVSHFLSQGVPLLRTQNVKEFCVDLEEIVYIDEDFHNKLKKSQVFPGYVLIARSGSIGNAAVVQDNFPVANSADIILIKPKKQMRPEYLAAFLNSKYGKFQIVRFSSGGLQGHLNLFSLEKLFIPIFDDDEQQAVKELANEGFSKLANSKKLYQQAEKQLLEELGLENYEAEKKLFSIANLSDCQGTNRIDAEYFQPKFYDLFQIIAANSKIETLNKISKIQGGSLIDPQFYLNSGKQYIRGADFDNGKISKEKAVFIDERFQSKNETIVSVGDIVFASIGSVGNLAIVDKDSADSYISNNLSRISVNEEKILPEYLLVVLKSIVGQSLFEKESSQTAQPKISDSQVKSFTIPILPKSTQEKIADLVRKSHEARKKSKELLEDAKGKVEEMIEKGGG